MEIDSGSTELESCKKREEILKSFATSISKLSSSSRGIPSEKDFHFFLNFDEFKIPVKEIEKKAEELLKKIGSSRLVWGKSLDFPEDPDDAFDWMVNANDEIFEKFDSVLDEIQRSTSSMDSQKHIGIIDEEGFQLVSGRKKKVTASKVEMSGDQSSSTSVKVASRDKKTNSKSSIPFHIPSIPRPQDQFKILVNNTNAPFEHVWLPKSEDGSRVVHPLENMSVLDFVDRNLGDAELTPPLPLESSPFKFVQKVDELKELAAKLQRVDEFAIDLEHNQYRSFQGLTCLMQISTRTEDYVVDTLKLRVHVGPYLREVFKNPFKRKVMHGADRDIIWLQRDFGIYVCNLFDTGQASRVLQLERNSLEHILHHFCGVHAKKEYQTADWRLRPLPEEMLMYAREDTHYLLHIYDQMRRLLLPGSGEFGQSDDLLLEVYKRSYDICMRLYEKEIHTDTSYLYIYGLQGAELNSQQLAVLAGLYHWRDCVARLEDESTGYILPNKTLIEIAKQMPITSNQLCRLVRSKHPYVEKNSGSLINIIKNSIANASTFEDVAEQLKKAKETTLEEDIKSEPQRNEDETLQLIPKNEPSNQRSDFLNHSQIDLPDKNVGTPNSTKVASVVSVSVSKKPNRAFGALLGSSVSKRKVDSVHEGILSDKDNAEMKVEQIKSSIVLPFHSFLSDSKPLKPVASEHVSFKETEPETCDGHIDNRGKLEEIIPLENASSDADSMSQDETTTPKNHSDLENGSTLCLSSESEKDDHPTSSSGLSSTFAKCLKSVNEERGIHKAEKRSPQTENSIQLTPFDYASARRQRFGEREEKVKQAQDDNVTKYAKLNSRRMNANVPFGEKNGEKELNPGEKEKDFQQSRRRQAFPASGNRTATFR